MNIADFIILIVIVAVPVVAYIVKKKRIASGKATCDCGGACENCKKHL